MNKNRRMKRRITAGLALGISAMMCMPPVMAAENTTLPEATVKDETVYVSTDASGNQKQVVVSDWLKNIGSAETVKDQSSLKDIKNVKGEEAYTEKGNQLIWETDGKDIYYQGTTGEKLPVSVKLTYYLDGKEIKPSKLKGKSGHLDIQIEYQNHAKKSVEVNGEKEEMYTPFMLMTGLILPNETFSNVVIDDGKVISDGNRSIVLGFAAPGLKDSLGLESEEKKEDAIFPESLKISADVQNFKMSSTFTVALPDVLEELHLESITDGDSLKKALDDLENAALELVSGTEELSNGAETLSGGVNEYTEGADQLNDAIQTYLGEDGELSGQVTTYVNGVNTAVQGAQKYISGVDTLADGVLAYVEGEKQLAAGAENLGTLKSGLTQVQKAVAQLSSATDGKLTSGETMDLKLAAQALADGTQKLADSLDSDTMQHFFKAMEELTQTGETLLNTAESMAGTLEAGVEEPVKGIAASIQDISGELSKLQGIQQEMLDSYRQINDVIASDNEKISRAKTAAAQSQSAIGQSVEELTEQKTEMEKTDPQAAASIQEAIDALNAAGNATEAVNNMQELDALPKPDWSMIDMNTMNQEVIQIQKNMNTFSQAASALTKELPDLKEQLETLKNSQNTLPSDQLDELEKQIKILNAGMQAFNYAIGGTGGFSDSLGQLNQSVEKQFPEAIKGLDSLNLGFSNLSTYNENLISGAGQLKSAGSGLNYGLHTLSNGTETLSKGLNILGSQLSQGASRLSGNSQMLRDGASALSEGAGVLKTGMKQFEQDGTGKMKSTIEDSLGEVLERLDILTSEEMSYDSFSGKAADMDGNVKFVIETEGIE